LRCGKKVRQLPLVKRVYNRKVNNVPISKTPPNLSLNDCSNDTELNNVTSMPSSRQSCASVDDVHELSNSPRGASTSNELATQLDKLNLTFTLDDDRNDLISESDDSEYSCEEESGDDSCNELDEDKACCIADKLNELAKMMLMEAG
jgi:hypothetical protein